MQFDSYLKVGLALITLLFFACESDKEAPLVSKTGVEIPDDGSAEIKRGGVITKDGILLNYLVAGNSEKALIVPNSVLLVDDFRSLSDQFTVISYDLRNRGRSAAVRDRSKLQAGIQNDVKDLEAIREHFELEQFSVIGHSYLSTMVALYAQQYPNRLEKMIQIAAISPYPDKTYTGADSYADSVMVKMNRNLEALLADNNASKDPNFARNGGALPECCTFPDHQEPIW